MNGVVEVYRGEEKILEEPNMLMDNLGSQIAFWMSLPRGFESIPEAESIYDTSNYTIRAASLGKDAAGYNRHAHSPRTAQVSSLIKVRSNDPTTLNYDIEKESTYYDASISSTLARYKVLPEDSKPSMQRLEKNSTRVFFTSSTLDVGHNLNLIPSGQGYVSAGCYCTSAATTFQILDQSGVTVRTKSFSTNTRGFNSSNGVSNKAIDSRGFIRVNVNNILDGKSKENLPYYGLITTYTGSRWNPRLNLYSLDNLIILVPQDVVCLNFFGGVYTIGLWGFDIEKMMDKGMYPPYNQYPIEDIEYKLLARKTFTQDLTKFDDITQTIQDLRINWRINFI